MAENHRFDQRDCRAAASRCVIPHVPLLPASSLTTTLHFSPLDAGTVKKRGGRAVSVISYHPLFSSPFFLPSWEASTEPPRRVRNMVVAPTLLRSPVLGVL